MIANKERSFGLIMAAAFGVIAALRFVLSDTVTWWALGLAAGFALIALVRPRWLAPVERVWMRFAAVLGAINSRVLLTIVFALVVTPIAVLLRALGRQPMRWQDDQPTYWRRRRPEEFTAARMERQF